LDHNIGVYLSSREDTAADGDFQGENPPITAFS
jgi:hypothetical protein